MLADPLPDLVFAGAAPDRAAELRSEAGVVARLLTDPSTRVVDVAQTAVGVVEDDATVSLRRRSPEAADYERELVLLGRSGDIHLLAALGSDLGGELTPLREVAHRLPAEDAALAASAVAMDNWHRTHPRCPRCGEPTTLAQAGWTRRCDADGSEHYPRTDAAVIMAVVDDDDRLLLARGADWPEGRMSLLAGFVEPGETLASAVVREVAEEVGIEVTDVRYVADQPWPFPASLMVGFTARATTTELHLDPAEIVDAEWFSRAELADAYDSGRLRRPAAVSISARLVERWYGGPLAVGTL